ncbi:PREDICTED: auxin-responsive protein SAUR36-like [Tarenaya hassleriana]|uniref:auxin-responsive protein SAUR36-like n=1 Tax=Tarenaya hassleriana TaxID=28532 RepID=UPI00053C6396|nr:PREDICTED: auxin-responsive protein SAUR36-like [Tarenaya hassleriana]
MKFRGIRIRRRILRTSRWILRKTRIRLSGYNRLCPTRPDSKPRTIAKLISWGRRLRDRARLIGSRRIGSGYIPVGQDPIGTKPDPVPKGHLAVYVGKKDGDFHRVLVPVVYFNHPLFGELLREAEEEFGFSHQGGITIPCPYSDFERVQTRIESWSGSRKLFWSRNRH